MDKSRQLEEIVGRYTQLVESIIFDKKVIIDKELITVTSLQRVLKDHNCDSFFDLIKEEYSRTSGPLVVIRGRFQELRERAKGLEPNDINILCDKLRQILDRAIQRLEEYQEAERNAHIRVEPLMNKELASQILASLAVADEKLLFAGLTAAVKDTESYATLQREHEPNWDRQFGAEKFKTIIDDVRSKDKKNNVFNYDSPENELYLPRGIIRCSMKDIDISPLLDIKLITKWSVRIGKRIFEACSRPSKKFIYEDPWGPYQQVRHGATTSTILWVVIETILRTMFSFHEMWYPVAAYLAILIVRKPLQKYCAERVADDMLRKSP